ncbi:MAG: PIN domain-containing protein [Pyrinomonadaceae bacterium]|mgnify:FL=1|nr:PIN domain-containing protein [Pyrinomonadaceae bacterium]
MTSFLLDTGFLYALVDDKDIHHNAVFEARSLVHGQIILPIPAVTEACYFVRRNLGMAALADFLDSLTGTTDLLFEVPIASDYTRSAEILRKYNDSNIDFVDACIVAMAERLNITKILTVDRRHFTMFRPAHCEVFEILPQ